MPDRQIQAAYIAVSLAFRVQTLQSGRYTTLLCLPFTLSQPDWSTHQPVLVVDGVPTSHLGGLGPNQLSEVASLVVEHVAGGVTLKMTE